MLRRLDDLTRLVLAAAVVVVVAATATSALLFVTGRGGDGVRATARTERSGAPALSASRTSSPSRTSGAAPSSPVAATPSPSPARIPRGPGTTAADGTVTYVVRRGDTLFDIAEWFRLHGYWALYERNADVIGCDPDLIVPGERLTVSPAGASFSR